MNPAVTITLTLNGEQVWAGSLREFLKANEFARPERHEICRGLRSNPVRFGGGAAPAFTVALARAAS